MARFYPTGGSGAGTGSDECTATKGDVLKGKTAVTSDSDDEAAAGTLELTGNAGAANVLAGKTFYSTDAKSKQSGTMPNVAAIDPAKSTSMSGGNLYVRMTNGAHVQNASSGYPEVSVPTQTKTATPGASAVTVSPDANKVLEKVTVNAVSGLSAGNIKNGATVGGVKGTYKGLGNASQGQVLAGKTFSTASLSNATGTMTDHTAKPSKIQNRRLANGRFEVAVDAGYYKCSWADGSYEYMELSEVASTAGLTAAKLWPGNTVLGITSNKSTMAGKTITPSTSQQTVSCNGKAMTGNIVVNAIPSSYINTGNWTVFNAGTFSSGFGLVPNLVEYNENRQPNAAGTGGTIHYSEESTTVPAQSMSKMSTALGDTYYREGAIIIDGNTSYPGLGGLYFKEGQTVSHAIYDYPGGMVLFNRAIDLTNFSKIKVTRSIAQGNTEVSAYMNLCPSNKKAFGVSEDLSVFGQKTGTFTKECDVSGLSGQYFLGFDGYTSYNNYWMKITKIELVK